MECKAPFTLKKDNECCGYCWAPDDVVALDRHKTYTSEHQADVCPSAPAHC